MKSNEDKEEVTCERGKIIKQPIENWRNMGTQEKTTEKTRIHRSQNSILNRQVGFSITLFCVVFFTVNSFPGCRKYTNG